jgi:hypothetical protein
MRARAEQKRERETEREEPPGILENSMEHFVIMEMFYIHADQ